MEPCLKCASPLPLLWKMGRAILVLACGAIVMVVPVVVALWLRHRWRLPWKVLGVGALAFAASQLFTRIPLVAFLGLALEETLKGSPTAAWIWLVALSFSAGLFEETGRALGFRYLLKEHSPTRRSAILFGIGHGALEAVVLVGLNLVVAGALLGLREAMPTQDLGGLGPVVDQVSRALDQQPDWAALLAVWERAAAMVLHVGLTLMVVSALRERRLQWIIVAILLHGVVNLVAVIVMKAGSLSPATSMVLSELAVTLGAAAVIAIGLRRVPREPPPAIQTVSDDAR